MRRGDIRLTYQKNGIPYLSAARIDEIGEGIARELQPDHFEGQIDATDLRLLLSFLEGWRFHGDYLSRSGRLLGCAVFQEGQILVTDERRLDQIPCPVREKTILVDRALYREEAAPVFRFTVAHECGHALLHGRFCQDSENMKAYAAQGKEKIIRDEQAHLSPGEERRLQTERDWLEWQANAFASGILMPRTLIRRTARIIRQECPDLLEFYNQLLLNVCDVFKVSATAAFYRLKGLGLLPEDARLLRGKMIVTDVRR